MRIVRCDSCGKEAELISYLGNGFPKGFTERVEGHYCKDCADKYDKMMKGFNKNDKV